MGHTPTQFPIGIDDFRELITCRDDISGNKLFIDKSLIIRDLLKSRTKVTLFTRPRRFGKTLVLSMLQHFFAAAVNGNPTAGMFDELKIAAYSEAMKHQGQYPVIFLSFKDCKGSNFAETQDRIYTQIQNLYEQHQYLSQSPKLEQFQKDIFYALMTGKAEKNKLSDALKSLSRYLYLHYEKQVIILIDEYDSPILSAYNHHYYSECVDFMRHMLSGALKGNASLQFGVITGILRVAKESLFSGLNNLGVYSIIDQDFSEYFGFTEDETNYLIGQVAEYDIDHQLIKASYNGYKFGETVIYNPWSIVNCLRKKGELRSYWVNTSDNTLIKNLIISNKKEIVLSFNNLIQGESIDLRVREDTVFPEIPNNKTSVYNFLLMAGYLTIDSKEISDELQITAKARIPNHEITGLYKNIITGWVNIIEEDIIYENFLKSLIAGNVEEFIKTLRQITSYIISYFDVTLNKQESFYHGLMLGIVCGITKTHEVRSNRESGSGRYDLMIIPKNVEQYPLGIVMEFKFVKSEDQIEAAATEALTQAQTKNYEQELISRGVKRVLIIGLGFAGKEAATKYTFSPQID